MERNNNEKPTRNRAYAANAFAPAQFEFYNENRSYSANKQLPSLQSGKSNGDDQPPPWTDDFSDFFQESGKYTSNDDQFSGIPPPPPLPDQQQSLYSRTSAGQDYLVPFTDQSQSSSINSRGMSTFFLNI